ncbi:mannosyl-oligosaccharide alpha-1,2-mannosidase [Saitoella coloradoensis]
MSFNIPRNVPTFDNLSSRKYEDWSYRQRQKKRQLSEPFSEYVYKDKLIKKSFWATKKFWVAILVLFGLSVWYRRTMVVHEPEMKLDDLLGFDSDILQAPGLDGALTHPTDSAHAKNVPAVNGEIDWQSRRNAVKETFLLSWSGYRAHAWGMDEYSPVSRRGRNMIPNGLGWQIVDALDTAMLMDLGEVVGEGRDWIKANLTWEQDAEVNVFETTIRMLGGLLSAHFLSAGSGETVYLEKAIDLGDRLIGAYESQSGIPYASVNLKTGKGIVSHADGGASSTAEVATLQLEMKYLSHLTGDPKYWDASQKVIQRIAANNAQDGLVPIFIHPDTGKFRGKEIRLGSRGDSYYEYLLKMYLQTGKKEEVYKRMYDEAVDGVVEHLVEKSYPGKLTYIAELPSGIGGPTSPKMDHLVCFMGGNLALGATNGLTLEEARKQGWTIKQQRDFDLAEELTRTCWEMYDRMPSGLAPEIAYFNTGAEGGTEDLDIHLRDRHNLMRPETVESLFVMYRITGDEKYRAWGWNIFESFNKHSIVRDPETGEITGYTSLENVIDGPPFVQRDNMESFWLAETLKYLYLLFGGADEGDGMPLSKIVFNTEAHPLPVLPEVDVQKFGTWTM